MPSLRVSPGVAALARVVWMILGPMALAGVAVVQAGRGWLIGPDIACLSFLGVVLVARWVEFQGGHAETATGEPLTRDDLRGILMITAGVGPVTWVLANLIANHWLAA
jgi:hypothetical protein